MQGEAWENMVVGEEANGFALAMVFSYCGINLHHRVGASTLGGGAGRPDQRVIGGVVG